MRKLVLAVLLVLMASGAQAFMLDLVGGQLIGASDVLVDGSLYDVRESTTASLSAILIRPTEMGIAWATPAATALSYQSRPG